MANRNGFSLPEVVLAVGMFALAAVLFIGLLSVQTHFTAQNRDLAESMAILDDFCTFVDISSFSDIENLANERATLYVTESSEDNIAYRKFIAKNDWETSGRGEHFGHAVEIEQMGTLFADEDANSRCYIPLLCRLSKVNGKSRFPAMNRDFSMFVTIKNY
jgi:hypothetical protein